MKRRAVTFLLSLLLCIVFSVPACAEGAVINLIADPDAEYCFQPDVPILEVYYPKIYGSDCTVLRIEDHVMLIDGSSANQARERVLPMLQDLGIDHVELAFNTHPHSDHLPGLWALYEEGIGIDRVVMGMHDPTGDPLQRRYERYFTEAGIPVEYAEDNDILRLGPAELTVIARTRRDFTLNDYSACTMLRYGERTLVSLADIEERSQTVLLNKLPDFSLKADILKYPHHGQQAMKAGLYNLISPELTVLTSHETAEGKVGYAYVTKRGSMAISTPHGPLRLRTDGVIWVLDQYPEFRKLEIRR